jgi:hypothetical protein
MTNIHRCYGCAFLDRVTVGNTRLYRCLQFDLPRQWRGSERIGGRAGSHPPIPETDTCWTTVTRVVGGSN